jgi:hypothetical protein
MLLASSEAGVQHLKSLSAEEWSGLQAKGEAPAAR